MTDERMAAIERLMQSSYGFGIFAERELVNRRLRDKVMREEIKAEMTRRKETALADQAALLALLAEPEPRAISEADLIDDVVDTLSDQNIRPGRKVIAAVLDAARRAREGATTE